MEKERYPGCRGHEVLALARFRPLSVCGKFALCDCFCKNTALDQSKLAVEVGVTEQPSSFFYIPSATPTTFEERFSVLLREQNSVVDVNVSKKGSRLEQEDFSFRDHSAGAISPQPHSSYSGLDPDAELPPDKKLADIVLDSAEKYYSGRNAS